jgi:single-stranded DNA-binding protein
VDYQRIAVSLIGNAARDAEIKQAKESGRQYGDFRLAVRDRNGETVYFPVRCFGKLAEGAKAIRKGTKLFVDGQLEISSFTGDEGGKRMSFRVVADTYRILESRKESPEEPSTEMPADEDTPGV